MNEAPHLGVGVAVGVGDSLGPEELLGLSTMTCLARPSSTCGVHA